MNRTKWIVLFCYAFLFLTGTAHASNIKVSGSILKDSNWTADTVFINGNLTIPVGKTLTIQKGTTVMCLGRYQIIADGRIIAQGDKQHKILFTVADTTSFSADSEVGGWKGFIINSDITTPSLFDYCQFRFIKGEEGFSLYTGYASFMNSAFYNNRCTWLLHIPHSKIKVAKCIFCFQ